MSFGSAAQLLPNRTVVVAIVGRLYSAAKDPTVVKAVKEAAPKVASAAKALGKVIAAFRSAWHQP
ncbi:hypothetical protein BKA04_001637 [Cryobacterium mesophilum]|nr:hypothetical protein [Terrimesophilobacter mesophilus]